MKRLYLLRHAKSSWVDASLSDRDRPLAPRGRKATKQLTRWLAAHPVRPELVVCSPALRTVQTWERVAKGLGEPELVLDESLYHAAADALLDRVRQLPDTVQDAMLVGHNPGLTALGLVLARPGELADRVAGNLPTGALATLELDVDAWSEAGPGTATFTSLVLPRELG